MGLSMDFIGGKIYDAVSAALLSAAQVLAADAGIMWSQVQNGLALANGLPGTTGNQASAFDPGVGLRYRF